MTSPEKSRARSRLLGALSWILLIGFFFALLMLLSDRLPANF